MGCDYYVYTYLEIKHKTGIAYIELEKTKGWFCDCIEPNKDSDDEEENYKNKCNDYYEIFLKPSINPILIYDGKRFVKQHYNLKYSELIQQKIDYSEKYWRDTGTLVNMTDIQQIRKVEVREKT